MKKWTLFLVLSLCSKAWADIPATPVMTLYQFNGDLEVPYYKIDSFLKKGPASPAGTLPQGTSLIPCLVIRDGEPVTDRKGTPYVGFTVVVDSGKATPASVEVLESAWEERRSSKVRNHHCDNSVRYVIDVRKLIDRQKAPFFDPPLPAKPAAAGQAGADLDRIVRAFHNSPRCAEANKRLVGRRAALATAWDSFARDSKGTWPDEMIARARHLDYTMRTALYEGHLDRGCNAYGACERNIIALSIRNRARGQCLARQGCRYPNDFEGAASAVSQYNIWDEYLAQISGLTACFLRDDLSGQAPYSKLQAMYAQSAGDVEKILFGSDAELQRLFPGNTLNDILSLRHYYHAPAMGKCFPGYPRVEYISGAVARKGNDFALIANTRIDAGEKTGGGYFFREFGFREDPDRDVVEIRDNYPGFVIDDRKVSLGASRCPPYGIPAGCRFEQIGRYRRTPSWLGAGKPLELTCHIADRGAGCEGEPKAATAKVGGVCDKEMRPVAGVH